MRPITSRGFLGQSHIFLETIRPLRGRVAGGFFLQIFNPFGIGILAFGGKEG